MGVEVCVCLQYLPIAHIYLYVIPVDLLGPFAATMNVARDCCPQFTICQRGGHAW